MGANKTRLQFYDTWNPDYVYFNSLLKIDTWNEDIYDMDFIRKQAKKAAGDAQKYQYLNGLNADESIEEFKKRFIEIIKFLKQAYEYEQKNEEEFFTKNYNTLINAFSKEEIKSIPQLQECIDMLEDGTRSFDYKKFTTLINILLEGMQRTKIISDYEGKRITKISKALKDITDKKYNQLEGQAFKQDWPNAREHINKLYKRFTRKIDIEYATTGQLDRKNSNNQFIIRGAFRLKGIQQTAYRELANWVEQQIRSLKDNPQLIAQLAVIISNNYPANGNFNKLEGDIRTAIIASLMEYGRKHLYSILNKRIKPKLENVIDDLLTKDKSILDNALSLNLYGLPEGFGQNVHEAELLKEISTINAAYQKHATEIYTRITALIQREENAANTIGRSDSYLIKAMKNVTTTSNDTLYSETQNIMFLIEEIRKLQQLINEDIKKIGKTQKKLEKEYEIKNVNNQPTTIKVIIKDGIAKIDMQALNQFVVDNKLQKKSNATSLSNLIRSITGQASKDLRDKILQSLTYAHNNGLFNLTEQELLNEIEAELRTIKIHIDGPKTEEVAVGMAFNAIQNGRGIYNASKNNKNDFVFIQIDASSELESLKKRFEKLGRTNLVDFMTRFEKAVEDAQLNLLETIQNTMDDEIQKIIHTDNSSQRYSFVEKFSLDNIENLRKEYEKIDEAYKKLESKTNYFLSKLGGKDKLGQRYENIQTDILKKLQSGFYLSNTTKAYNTYNNNMGFKGGSLGYTFEDQLNTIADIFQSAGLPINDLIWIRSAILNCFPSSVVGEVNKGMLENYLGAIAAFALFDEGGDETQLISKVYKEYFSNMTNQTNTRILHLYRVNSIYVPGSQVLLRTINTLEQEVMTQIDNIPTTVNRGAGVMIINTTSQKDITGNDNNTWKETGEKAKQHVKIKILFLAQLLDIINAINEEINDIEMLQ